MYRKAKRQTTTAYQEQTTTRVRESYILKRKQLQTMKFFHRPVEARGHGEKDHKEGRTTEN